MTVASAWSLAATAATAPAGPGYVFEPKYDGFRTLISIDAAGSVRIRRCASPR